MKLTPMQHKYLLRAALILLLIAGSYLILRASTKNQDKRETCKENMGECSKSKDENNIPSGESLIETFSRQFISSSIIDY
jgi:hypothetical protein